MRGLEKWKWQSLLADWFCALLGRGVGEQGSEFSEQAGWTPMLTKLGSLEKGGLYLRDIWMQMFRGS